MEQSAVPGAGRGLGLLSDFSCICGRRTQPRKPSRLPHDIPCVPGIKDLTPEQGPFPPPCLGPQDMGIYLVSPTLEEGEPGFHSHMFWTVS